MAEKSCTDDLAEGWSLHVFEGAAFGSDGDYCRLSGDYPSTTVIEVGVNVPNATVMMVENAERFGLAQLHQLRGRVGRGSHQSYCIFVSGSDSKETRKRLEILNRSNDGFYIASEDLKLRGPGDLFGVRQSGILEFRIGDIFTDALILQAASEEAAKLEKQDPDLSLAEHRGLREKLSEYRRAGLERMSL